MGCCYRASCSVAHQLPFTPVSTGCMELPGSQCQRMPTGSMTHASAQQAQTQHPPRKQKQSGQPHRAPPAGRAPTLQQPSHGPGQQLLDALAAAGEVLRSEQERAGKPSRPPSTAKPGAKDIASSPASPSTSRSSSPSHTPASRTGAKTCNSWASPPAPPSLPTTPSSSPSRLFQPTHLPILQSFPHHPSIDRQTDQASQFVTFWHAGNVLASAAAPQAAQQVPLLPSSPPVQDAVFWTRYLERLHRAGQSFCGVCTQLYATHHGCNS